MKKNHELLLAYLKKQSTPISSTALADMMKVSSRSVKNYVNEINAELPGSILSSKQGYFINTQSKTVSNNDEIPQTYAERSSYIIKEFFVHHCEELDIYELCDALYLSYSSIKSLLQKMNKEYEVNKIRFQCRNDRLYVTGSERDKRRFLTSIIYKEATGNLVDITVLKEMFPAIDVMYINDLLHTCFKQDNCYINDFGYMNLNLHITVMLNSILNQSHGTYQNHLECIDVDNPLAEYIVEKLQKHFQINFQRNEIEEMASMISMNIHMCQINSQKDIQKSVGNEVYQLSKDLIHALNQQYHLHIQEKTLLLPLALHLKNLLERVNHNTYLHNPLLDTIQSACPILFDCALYAADFLYQRCHIQISKDEVAYLAMHIGADVERQDQDIHKLKCVLLCPDYQKNRSFIYNFLLIHFDSQISIIQCVSFVHEINETEYDLLFTTIPVQETEHPVIQISPFTNSIDIRDVFNRLEEVIEKQKLVVLHQEFDHFFSSKLFYYEPDNDCDKLKVIHILNDKLLKQGHVNTEFYHDVIKRDEAASTAFGKIAIPHSMKMNANHTRIAVAISQEGIKWDQQLVHIVLLIAINEKESYLFRELYEALINFCTQENIMTLLKDCTTFDDFRDIIKRFTR